MNVPAQIFHSQKPFFLYSERELRESLENVRKFWSRWSLPGFELFFSVKVNPNPHLLRIISRFADGFDVSSLAEAKLVESLSWSPRQMTWSGPAKARHAFEYMASRSLRCIHLDSVDEWTELQRYLGGGQGPYCSVRISTSELHSQKLGFSDAELNRFRLANATPQGAVHSYLGRETFSQASLDQFHQRLDEKIAKGFFKAEPEIFLGAGIPSQLILQREPSLWSPTQKPHRRLHLESGRGLIQSCGWYGTRILSKKDSDVKKNIIIDGGLQHLATHFLSPRFKEQGVVVRFFRDGQELLDRSEQVSIHGSLSLWHDTMIEGVQAPAGLKRGDWIVANHLGAYGYSAASNQFLGPSPVREWLLTENQELKDISPPRLVPYQEAF